jgi:hypothetical protein
MPSRSASASAASIKRSRVSPVRARRIGARRLLRLRVRVLVFAIVSV